jgi:hypothetical protein
MRRYLLVLCGIAALTGAGCGGGNSAKDDYVKQLNDAGKALNTQLTALGTDISSQTDTAGIATKLNDGAGILDGVATKLTKVKTPDKATAGHAALIKGVKDLAGTFRQLATTAQSGKIADVTKAVSAVPTSPGVTEIAAATQKLAAAGYKIG